MKRNTSGAGSRRKFLTTSLVGVLGSLTLAGCATLGLPRIAKASADYMDHAKGTNHCGDYVHFNAPHGCSVVEGRINPAGVCNYFLKKT